MRLFRVVLGFLLSLAFISVISGCGGGGGGKGSGTTYSYFTYVAYGKSIAIYSMNNATGELTASGSFTTPDDTYPQSLVVHPTKPYLYVGCANSSSKKIRVLRIAPTTGSLSEVQSIDSDSYTDIEITPNGKYLFTAGSGNQTSSFSVADDGKLTKCYNSAGSLVHIKVAPDSQTLYATINLQVSGSGDIRELATYAIGIDGSLTKNASFSFTSIPVWITTTGQFIYVDVDGTLYQFNGGSTLQPNGTQKFSAGYFGKMVTVNGFLYTVKGVNTNPTTYYIAGFKISPTDGSLTEFTGNGYPYPTGTNSAISCITTDPNKKFLYATDEKNKVILGFIASNGTLTQLSSSPSVSGAPVAIATAKLSK